MFLLHASTVSIRKAALVLAALLVVGGLSAPAAQAVAAATSTVTGTITDSSGNPLEGVSVDIYSVDGEGYGDSALTDELGHFSFADVPAGEYAGTIQRDEDYTVENWNRSFVDYGYSGEEDPSFTVSNGATVTNDVVLYESVSISGRFDESDLASEETFVYFFDSETGRYGGYAYAGDSEDPDEAVFESYSLAPGTYRMEFNRSSGPALHAAQFFDSKDESAGTAAANVITLAEGESRTGVDANLDEGGKITGRVLDTSGNPVENCSIHAYTKDGHFVTRSDYTAADGTFSVGGLTTGAYRLAYNGSDYCTGPERFFDDSSSTNLSRSESDGDTISVVQGDTTALAEDLVVGDDVPADPEVIRYGGSDRYSTATEISKGVFEPGVDAVFIATGLGFADGLAAGPGAAKNDSPVLLVGLKTIPEVVKTELARLKPKDIYILGGTGVISAGVATQLAAFTHGGDVTRLSGADRYATAADAVTLWDSADTVYLASGAGFADALSGGAAAARDESPLLLTDPKKLQTVTKGALTRLDPTKVVITGGTGAVSAAVEAQVHALLPEATITRLDGINRFDTAAKALALAGGDSRPQMMLASGLDYPDALAGIPAAKELGSGFALALKTCVPPEVDAAPTVPITGYVLLGGTGALADGMTKTVCPN